jgi:D-beta-D-heptose 7-phosphate kinase/D-beta-D-heptose 1-phosphate adenosyltransferase
LTKGSDYESAEVLGREIVESYGGRIERIPIAEEISATQIINSIKKRAIPEPLRHEGTKKGI